MAKSKKPTKKQLAQRSVRIVYTDMDEKNGEQFSVPIDTGQLEALVYSAESPFLSDFCTKAYRKLTGEEP